MDQQIVRERIHLLRAEIAKIGAENREFRSAARPTYLEIQQHRRREDRLVRIIDEIAALTVIRP
jgi:hypothetical protein